MLLPILGSVVLAVLTVFLINLVKVVKTVNGVLQKSNTTIDLANQSIDKIQAPLDTVVKISGSVDKAHDAGSRAVAEAKEYFVKNADVIKGKVSALRNKKIAVEVKEVSSEEDKKEDKE